MFGDIGKFLQNRAKAAEAIRAQREKSARPISRILDVPAEHVLELAILADDYGRLNQKEDKEAGYRLWARIAEIFPKEDFRNKNWKLHFKNALCMQIHERTSGDV